MTTVDNKKRLKNYLLNERVRLIFMAVNQDLSFTDIASIFRVDKSVVTRIIADNMDRYKEIVKSNK